VLLRQLLQQQATFVGLAIEVAGGTGRARQQDVAQRANALKVEKIES
jgi:uncharacterized glyoxalase superfamily metalloenzyme YdcJ